MISAQTLHVVIASEFLLTCLELESLDHCHVTLTVVLLVTRIDLVLILILLFLIFIFLISRFSEILEVQAALDLQILGSTKPSQSVEIKLTVRITYFPDLMSGPAVPWYTLSGRAPMILK